MATGGRDEGQGGKAFKRWVWADQIVAAFKIKHKYMNQSKQTRRNDAGKASLAPALYGTVSSSVDSGGGALCMLAPPLPGSAGSLSGVGNGAA